MLHGNKGQNKVPFSHTAQGFSFREYINLPVSVAKETNLNMKTQIFDFLVKCCFRQLLLCLLYLLSLELLDGISSNLAQMSTWTEGWSMVEVTVSSQYKV